VTSFGRIASLAADEHQDNCNNNADDDTCCEGKIEGEVLSFIIEIAGEPSDPRYLSHKENKTSDTRYNQSGYKKNLADTGKIRHATPQKPF